MSKDIDESRDDVREFWQMVIELWRASGLSVREFCEREGVSAASLYGWRKRIGKMDQSQVCQEQDSELSSFIEVSMPTGEVGVLELVLTSPQAVFFMEQG